MAFILINVDITFVVLTVIDLLLLPLLTFMLGCQSYGLPLDPKSDSLIFRGSQPPQKRILSPPAPPAPDIAAQRPLSVLEGVICERRLFFGGFVGVV